MLLRSRCENVTPNFVGCFVHYCPVQLISEVFSDCICVETHLPRFEAFVYVLSHFDTLNSRSDSCVLGVHLSHVC